MRTKFDIYIFILNKLAYKHIFNRGEYIKIIIVVILIEFGDLILFQ